MILNVLLTLLVAFSRYFPERILPLASTTDDDNVLLLVADRAGDDGDDDMSVRTIDQFHANETHWYYIKSLRGVHAGNAFILYVSKLNDIIIINNNNTVSKHRKGVLMEQE